MNFGTPVPLLIGLILIVGAVVLFFLDKFKPGYGRDSDKVYSVLLLVAGMCALGELNLGIFPSLQLLIMAGMLIALLIENIRTRTPLEPVRPGAGMPPRGGRPRPVDRRPTDRRPVYRAELDDWDQFDDRPGPRTMPPARAYDDDRYRPRPAYEDRPPLRRLNPGGPSGQYDGDQFSPPNNRSSSLPRDSYGPPGGYREGYSDDRRPRPPRDNAPAMPRPPEARPNEVRPPEARPNEVRPPEGFPSGDDRSPAHQSGEPRRERTLDVRPYSEAPAAAQERPDADGSDYLDFRPVAPDRPSEDSDWR